MLAHEKKISVKECLKTYSYREYLSWMIFYADKWKELSLSDYYLMQISQRILQSVSKNPNKHTLDDQKIKFKEEKKEESKVSVEERTAIAKSRWGAWLQSTGTKYTIRNVER